MRDDWNARAEDDPLRAVVNSVPKHEWDLGHWLRTGEATLRRTLPLLESVDIESAWTVFEIGCGAGRLTSGLARRFQHVTGMDVSDVMLAKAGEVLHGQGITNVTLVHGPGDTLRFPGMEGRFDLVYSCIALQHIPSVDIQLTYLADMSYLLKAGGAYLVQLYDDHEDYPRVVAAWEERRQAQDVLGWDATLEGINRYETGIRTPLPHDRVQDVLAENALTFASLDGEGTSLWWIGGRKLW